MRDMLKSAVGTAASLLPQCRYDRSIFILAHMRCGSTALSNIFCSRPDVSGYGECHIRYTDRRSLGRLVVNQALRQGWKPGATHLFDKVLHDRHDLDAPEAFFTSRAVFIARDPGPAIRSIRKLYEGLERDEYGDDTAAATYYIGRVRRLIDLWDRFPENRRVGLTHTALVGDPEGELERISRALEINPPLENRYQSLASSRKGGGGDPTTSGKFNRIETRAAGTSQAPVQLDISDTLRAQADEVYETFVRVVGTGD